MFDQFKQRLKDHGFSLTRPRLAVFNYLQARDASTIAAIIAGHPEFDQASIYRALSLFRRLGIIEDIISGGHKLVELVDEFDRHHHHVICLRCGRSVTINDLAIEKRLDQLAQAAGFESVSHQVGINGICGDCAQLVSHG